MYVAVFVCMDVLMRMAVSVLLDMFVLMGICMFMNGAYLTSFVSLGKDKFF